MDFFKSIKALKNKKEIKEIREDKDKLLERRNQVMLKRKGILEKRDAKIEEIDALKEESCALIKRLTQINNILFNDALPRKEHGDMARLLNDAEAQSITSEIKDLDDRVGELTR